MKKFLYMFSFIAWIFTMPAVYAVPDIGIALAGAVDTSEVYLRDKTTDNVMFIGAGSAGNTEVSVLTQSVQFDPGSGLTKTARCNSCHNIKPENSMPKVTATIGQDTLIDVGVLAG